MAEIIVKFTDSKGNIISNYIATPSDEELNQFIQYFAMAENYQNILSDGSTNPESQSDFLIRKMKEYTENVVTSFAANQAAEDARQQILNNKITLD